MADGENQERELRESIIGLTAYPLLTTPVDFENLDMADGGGGGGGPTNGASSSGAPEVTRVIRDVLGWNPNPMDPRGFLGALEQSFDLKTYEGHVDATWRRRSFAVVTDLEGGVSGPQASLLAQAKNGIDQALPLFEGLRALALDADPEEVEAIRALIRAHLKSLLVELGKPGGPCAPRVDQIFDLLLGADDTETDISITTGDPNTTTERQRVGLRLPERGPDEVQGEIGRLREELGLDAADNRAINVGEETVQTKNRIATDHIIALRVAWIRNRPLFRRGSHTAFFGTQLVHLSRQLSVILESVQELEFKLTSVFIGPRERETLELKPRWYQPVKRTTATTAKVVPTRVPTNHRTDDEDLVIQVNGAEFQWVPGDPIFLGELLSWIKRFASEEATLFIREGGKLGVQRAFVPTAARLRRLVKGIRHPVQNRRHKVPENFLSPRVQSSLQELETQFLTLLHIADPIKYETDESYDDGAPPSSPPPPANPEGPGGTSSRATPPTGASLAGGQPSEGSPSDPQPAGSPARRPRS